MLRDYALTTFVTLAVVVDPIGLAPTFLSITQGLSARARREIGLRAAIIGAVILIATALGLLAAIHKILHAADPCIHAGEKP